MKKDFNLNIFIETCRVTVESSTIDKHNKTGIEVGKWLCVDERKQAYELFSHSGDVEDYKQLATVLNARGHRSSRGEIITPAYLETCLSRARNKYPLDYLKELTEGILVHQNGRRDWFYKDMAFAAGANREITSQPQ
jgi:hypothetical protein